MKKLILLLMITVILFAQMPTSEYLYLDIYSDITAKLPNRNPAYMSADNIPYSYAFKYNLIKHNGEYRLPFDPSAKIYHNTEVSAYQEMENGILFAGRFAYRSELRKDKMWLHNAETNVDIPLYFADSTTGDFNLNGIDWNIIFSYPLTKNLRIAMDIFYNVDEQFKSVFPKPNSKRNNLHVRPAMSFENENIRLGVTSSIFNFKEEIETRKYSLEQNRTPIFMRIRGLDRALLSYAETTEERLQDINGYGASVDIKLFDLISIEGSMEEAAATITDGGSDPIDQGSWDMNRLYYRAALHTTASRHVDIDLYFKQYWTNAMGYHPDLNALIYQYGNRQFEGGILVPFTPLKGETWTNFVSYGFEDIKREDNFLGLSHYIPWTTLSLGFNYDLVRQEADYILKFKYSKINIGETVEYNEMSDWYYDTITANEIKYYATEREEMEAGARIILPFRDMKVAIDGVFKTIQPVESEELFHEANVSLELMF